VVYNTGIAFSMLDGHSSLVYCLQSIVCGVVLIAILFLREWYYIILLSLAFVGGIFNMVDRATQFLNHQPNAVANSVIDYLNTGTTTSNFPDVFILTGVIGFTALFVIISVVNTIRPPKTSDKTKSEVK
jgi:lipoprotein signal peptidase